MKNSFTWLIIDTSFKNALFALGDNGIVLVETRIFQGFKTSESLIYHIDDLLFEVNIKWEDLGAIAVGLGPGSFTGIRMGLCLAKGIAEIYRIPILGFNSFCGIKQFNFKYFAIPASQLEYYLYEINSIGKNFVVSSDLPNNTYIESNGLSAESILGNIPGFLNKEDKYVNF